MTPRCRPEQFVSITRCSRTPSSALPSILYRLQKCRSGSRYLMGSFYFFDNGVTRALLGSLQDPPTPLEQGRLFEQWILQEIVRLNEYNQKDWKLSFWRTSHGAEVDVVISRGTRILYAVECKFKRQPSSRDLSGLRSFHDNNPEVPCFVVSPVNRSYRLSFARILPPENFFRELK